MALASSLALLLAAAPAAAASPESLWRAWPARRFVTTAAPCLRHAELGERLQALAARHPQALRLETVGRSVEGRKIRLATLGRGPRRVLLWSQMHGDEPSATPALLDLAASLLEVDTPENRLILDRLTLLLVPMLNPDGAERYERRNAQAIDVNRDALSLATPEGLLLKQLRDRFEPELGFNLHDQNRRTTVGETGVPASIALLAVAGDPQGTLTPGRARAKRACSAIARALAPFVPGAIARYDEDWSPRAFGDNLTKWGTPVVLIESGAVPPGRELSDLTRLNYVALVTTLHGLASDDLAGEDPALYERLARNRDGAFVDVLLAGGRIWQPPAGPPYRADVAFDVLDEDTRLAACPAGAPDGPSRIREVGDGRLLAAARRRDVAGRLLVPALAASVRGLEARAWLTPEGLDAVSRLGVARLRWHVAGDERESALAHAGSLGAAPGRAAVEVAEPGARAHALVVTGPPTPAAGGTGPLTLAAAVAALARGGEAPAVGESTAAGEAAVAGEASASAWLLDLLGAPPGEGPRLRPDARASLLVLRPLAGESLDPASLAIEAVFLDGREVRGAGAR